VSLWTKAETDRQGPWLHNPQQLHIHHISWVPIHDRIFQVEPLQIAGSGSLDLFWESKSHAGIGDPPEVELDKEMFLFRAEEFDILRRPWLCSMNLEVRKAS
jgi:hypothetical protein